MTPAMAFGLLALAAAGLVVLNATGHAAGPAQASAGPSPVVSASQGGASGAGPVGAVGAPSPRIVYVTVPVATPAPPHARPPGASPSSSTPRPSASSSTSSGIARSAVTVAAVALTPTPSALAGASIGLFGIDVALAVP